MPVERGQTWKPRGHRNCLSDRLLEDIAFARGDLFLGLAEEDVPFRFLLCQEKLIEDLGQEIRPIF